MLNDCKVLGSLYYNTTCSYPFKDVHGLHMNWDISPLNRSVWRITDLDLFFTSDLNEGCELVIKRVSKNGKYEFSIR